MSDQSNRLTCFQEGRSFGNMRNFLNGKANGLC